MIDSQTIKHSNSNSGPLIFLVGPTAIGKTELSLRLANEFNAEIIGVDSMQIYKYMDIGTAKPTKEERSAVPHHLIDFIDPADKYNVSRFVSDAESAIASIYSRSNVPVMAGGTGLYFKGFHEGLFELPSIATHVRQKIAMELDTKGAEVLYSELLACDPESASRIHVNDKARVVRALEVYRGTGLPWSKLLERQQQSKQKHENTSRPGTSPPLKIGLQRDRDVLYERINTRVDIMLEQGLLNEVEKLLSMGYSASLHSMQSLGYRHMLNFLNGEWSWQEAIRLLARDTRRYAKRQLTWFRKDMDINWYSPEEVTAICNHVRSYINSTNQANTNKS